MLSSQVEADARTVFEQRLADIKKKASDAFRESLLSQIDKTLSSLPETVETTRQIDGFIMSETEAFLRNLAAWEMEERAKFEAQVKVWKLSQVQQANLEKPVVSMLQALSQTRKAPIRKRYFQPLRENELISDLLAARLSHRSQVRSRDANARQFPSRFQRSQRLPSLLESKKSISNSSAMTPYLLSGLPQRRRQRKR